MIYNLRPVRATINGAAIAPLLLRSSAPFAGGDQASQLAPYGVRAVVDLRDPDEVRMTDPWGEGLALCPAPIFSGRLAGLQWEGLPDLYEHMVTGFGDRLASAITAIATELGDGPVLVNCTAGKDRTGLVVALILTLLGASRDDIYADYLASSKHLNAEYLAALADLNGVEEIPGIAAHRATATDVAALRRALTIVEDAGGARAYLRAHGMNESVPDLLAAALVGGGA